MDARPARLAHRFGAARDVGFDRAGEAGDDGVLGARRDGRDGLEVALGGDRETGLDNVDAHRVENLGHLQLVFKIHRRAGRLFAVAERRVENDDGFGIFARLIGVRNGIGLGHGFIRQGDLRCGAIP